MSQFTNALRHITKKASHPNALLYSAQLERAKQKYLVQGQLEDGKEGAVALGAPELDRREREGEKDEIQDPRNGTVPEGEVREGESQGVKREGGEAERGGVEKTMVGERMVETYETCLGFVK
jgi:hypothetical protein